MKKLFIIANWKANKSTQEANNWFKVFQDAFHPQDENKHVIICPPALLIPLVKQKQTEKNNFSLGLQDFSPFEKGAYTGEDPAELSQEFADYAIIGHSERRTYFKESEELIAQKVSTAQKYQITPIFCIQDEHTPTPRTVSIVAYEPPTAIGSGHPDTPEDADKVADIIKTAYANVRTVLYGGSVTPENVHKFTKMEHIDGVLVGGASLDPVKFIDIIQNA
jgi:triosephosphate isomerase